MSWQAVLVKTIFRVMGFFAPSGDELDVPRERAVLEGYTKVFKPLGKVDITRLDADGVPAAWVVPSGLDTKRIVLYLHGGGYNAGSITSHLPLTSNIALAAKARILAIDYRLAPEHLFPAAVEDALKAYQWLLKGAVQANQIVIAGDSAGGGLTLSLLLSLREKGLPLPAAAVCLSPWTDLTCSSESWETNAKMDFMLEKKSTVKAAKLYLGDADPRSPLASPLYADPAGLPPLLILVGSEEVLLSDSTRFAEKARLAGVDITLENWKGMQHVWPFAASLLPEGRQAVNRIGEFIIQHYPER
jgi:monoterpene epsilon-lactone hydrolase